jgi:hypothetical protein
MILKTYTRVITNNLEASLNPLKMLVGREPDICIPLPDIAVELVAIGDFLIIAGPKDSIKSFRDVLGPVIVDDLEATQTMLEQSGAEIYSPIREVSTGRLLFSRTLDGVVIEWLEWRSDIWKQVKAASAIST